MNDKEKPGILSLIPDHSRFRFRLTFQEKKLLEEIDQDLRAWQEIPLFECWNQWAEKLPARMQVPQLKEKLLQLSRQHYESMRSQPARYETVPQATRRTALLRPELQDSDKKIFGLCPVASDETVCCNLQTLDAVENCAFGCSYCTIQTFYGDRAIFDNRFEEKLKSLQLDPEKTYHFGTGQSSDSLAWGNLHQILDHLCAFARKNPNVILEFKTKSSNTQYFTSHNIPSNVMITWSLNPQTVIDHEEHSTASLEQRLEAAARITAKGILTGFHFHPMIHYENWEKDYVGLSQQIQKRFKPEQIGLLSFGSLTFIKPVIREIRRRNQPTQVLRMPMAPAGKEKVSYPESLKTQMFSVIKESFHAWQNEVFMYLCMEPKSVWEKVFGNAYSSNIAFETAMNDALMAKIKGLARKS